MLFVIAGILLTSGNNAIPDNKRTVDEILREHGFEVIDGAISGDSFGYDKKIYIKHLDDFIKIAKEKNVSRIYHISNIFVGEYISFLDETRGFLYRSDDVGDR